MAANNANEPDVLSVHFKGAEHRDTLKRIDLLHENITLQSQPVPNLGELFTSHPLNRGNKEILDATFPSIWSPLPGCTVKCRVETSSGGPQFFFKVVMHVDAGEDTLQFEAARLLMEGLSLDIMAYLLGKQPGAGELSAVMDNFPGLPWRSIERKHRNTLKNQQILADAVVRLHDAGINHAALCPGAEHHILYDKDTKRVNLVGFTSSAAGHYCHPSNREPEKVASSKKLCDDMDAVADILQLWYHDRLLKFDEKNNTPM